MPYPREPLRRPSALAAAGLLCAVLAGACSSAEEKPEGEPFTPPPEQKEDTIGYFLTTLDNQLKAWTTSGGYILIGEGYWRTRAHPDYLAVLGAEHAQFLDHRGNVQAGIAAGLIPMHAATANLDEWDEYEWKYCRSIERYAREQPEDPDVPAMLERIRKWRDGYMRWGRDTLGFAVYLFYRPGARMG